MSKQPKANIRNKQLEELKSKMEIFINERLGGDIRDRFIHELNRIYKEVTK